MRGGLAGVQSDPNPEPHTPRPRLTVQRGLQLACPCCGIARTLEGDAERTVVVREHVTVVVVGGFADQLLVACQRCGRLVWMIHPGARRAVDVDEPERNGAGRIADRDVDR